MIYYFSGTGNSAHVATQLGKLLGQEILSLGVGSLRKPGSARIDIPSGDSFILVVPIYAWGLPKVVERLLRQGTFDFEENTPAWMVCTCGDDIGTANEQWRNLVRAVGFTPMAAFSVTMPNTYVCLKGYDVDSPEVENQKLQRVASRVKKIAEKIKSGQHGKDDVVPGSHPWLKSHILRPLFNRFLTSYKPFYADDSCTSCGLCITSCPMENIVPGHLRRPAWGNHCAMCLRCYHICPHHSIQYGKATAGKGQYRHFLAGKSQNSRNSTAQQHSDDTK